MTRNRAEVTPRRQQVFDRARGRCELCGKPISSRWEDHHIFFKSRHFFGRARTVRDELWNRCCLHPLCHSHDSPRPTPHNDTEAREQLEAIAIKRLQESLPPQTWQMLLERKQGETNAAIVRAYETYRSGGFYLDVQLEPGAPSQN